MEEDDNKSFYKQKHEMNTALASQMRLHDLLNRIASLDASHPIDSPEKQKCYLNLVKQYFISAVPYLSKKDAGIYKNELLRFDVTKKSSVIKGRQTYTYQFDQKLDFRLNEILVELQIKLRKIFTKVRDEDDDGL